MLDILAALLFLAIITAPSLVAMRIMYHTEQEDRD